MSTSLYVTLRFIDADFWTLDLRLCKLRSLPTRMGDLARAIASGMLTYAEPYLGQPVSAEMVFLSFHLCRLRKQSSSQKSLGILSEKSFSRYQ